MALLFWLAIECGPDESRARSVMESFKGLQWTLSDGTIARYDESDLGLRKEKDGTWWFLQLLMGQGGSIFRLDSLSTRVELIQQVYSILETLSGYRFATMGWEIVGDLSFEVLLASRNDLFEIPQSTVLNRETWQALGSPPEFGPFGKDHYRRSLSSGDYRQIVTLFSDDE